MVKRHNGSSWMDIANVKKHNGSSWVNTSSVKRWDGGNWIDCMMTRQYFVENMSHIRAYHSLLRIKGNTVVTYNQSGFCYYAARVSNPYSDITADINFRAVMKNGTEYEIDGEFVNKLKYQLYLSVDFSMTRGASTATSAVYFGKLSFYDSGSYGRGVEMQEGETPIIRIDATGATTVETASVTIKQVAIIFMEPGGRPLDAASLPYRSYENNGIRW